jgi:chitodextrinase
VWSGTSAASPFTAGVVAAWLQAFPTATPEQAADAVAVGAVAGVLQNVGPGSPNRLLHAGAASAPPSGGGTAPGTSPAPGGATPAPPAAPAVAWRASCVRRACAFDARQTTSARPIARWSWDFGDGAASAAGPTPTRSYRADGTYVVRLTVTDAAGTTATRTDSVMAVDRAPTAALQVTCDGWTCAYSAAGSRDDGRVVRYAWEFGDGRRLTGSSPSATVAYRAAGVYAVRVTVTDDAGQTGSATATARTTPRPPAPAFGIRCAGRACTFDASPSRDDGRIVAYTWDFRDGSLQTGVTTTRTYAAAGTYTVRLTVRNEAGRSGVLEGRFRLR